ncbi:hypothetical protein MRX96_002855 [Rhipicephalus microplus]
MGRRRGGLLCGEIAYRGPGRKWEDVKGRVQGQSGAYTTERLARQRNSAPQLMMAVCPPVHGEARHCGRRQKAAAAAAVLRARGRGLLGLLLLCSKRFGASAPLSLVRELG